ncbi:MAG TPA: protein-L-isoaspartate(D-aspartate) O-methyltransferase [Bacillota bacterium]|nr:protein-L-isoaspartate(D-aspartate) O-methyltransferase [Bacillota bacterium]
MFDAFETKVHDPKVIKAIRKVPRLDFIPGEYWYLAEEDRPLPIGYQQTISQPLIVALMSELLELRGSERVLEIGTGSGYQTAVLAELAREVYTVELIEPLARQGRATLEGLGYGNIYYRIGDGYHGWEEHAPYQAILVAAAAQTVPAPLIEQLAEGGRMVLPLGLPGEVQTLWKVIKQGTELIQEDHGPVRFVPFVSGNEEML